MQKTINVTDIIFREDLYPRIKKDPVSVQKYAEDLKVLPSIEINQLNEIIDGWHRWTAHKKANAEQIDVTITETTNDMHLLELAIERNAIHGLSLSTNDKKTIARRIYRKAKPEERGQKKQRLAELLSMSYDTINRWLSRIDKDTEEERNAAVQNLWLQCYTQEEIAERVFGENNKANRKKISRVSDEICKYKICPIPSLITEDMPEDSAPEKVKKKWEQERQEKMIKQNQENAEQQIDFAVPVYNVWKQQEKTEGSSHYGNTEVRWVDNLLYLYTNPFDIVLDPFAGGGSTLDICKQRFRRCWASDRLPIEERQEIRQHDLIDGLPDLRKRWSEVKLVYLDPPYWKQSEGKYSQDENDLANMSLDTFHTILSNLIKSFAKKLQPQSYIALIIQPTQWNAPERAYTDHAADIIKAINLPINMRIQAPYESQQANAQMVEWAKENKTVLVLSREIIVWRINDKNS